MDYLDCLNSERLQLKVVCWIIECETSMLNSFWLSSFHILYSSLNIQIYFLNIRYCAQTLNEFEWNYDNSYCLFENQLICLTNSSNLTKIKYVYMCVCAIEIMIKRVNRNKVYILL